ncbi:MAG: heme biosynthesis HemY N-terminal domain-containing protein [Hyphomicrobiaceae bacterium]
MIRLVLFLVGIAALTAGLAWLADQPSSLVVDWQGYRMETTVFVAIVALALLSAVAILAWSLVRTVLGGPGAIGRGLRLRRRRHGLDAISNGLIAIGAGDSQQAMRHAQLARRALPDEPLTELLRAQAAQLAGDRATARRIYDTMLLAPETAQLGLRGLYLEAAGLAETEAAKQFAERALKLNPKLGWAADGLFQQQCKTGDWSGALETLVIARRQGHVEKRLADRRRAVLLTAQAQKLEDTDMDKAFELAKEAHGLAPDLVPAAAIAGRLAASAGKVGQAAQLVEQTWKRTPHPDLAYVYAYARPGDSPKDRLKRVRELAAKTPNNREARIAVARAAIDAREWEEARNALEPLVEDDLSERVCVLMARIEKGEKGDTGRVREWLARAVAAPRDPTWVADNQASNSWAPVSPVTGALDAYEWREAPEPPQRTADAGWLAEIVSGAETGPVIESLPAKVGEASAAPAEPEPVAPSQVADAEVATSKTLELRAGYSGPTRSEGSAEARAGQAEVTVTGTPPEGAPSVRATKEGRPAAVLVRRELQAEPAAADRHKSETTQYWAPDDPGTEEEPGFGEVAATRR